MRTIGQHGAGGPMTGGNYSLTGGFWALYAVQTPGAPLLKITINHHRLLALAVHRLHPASEHQPRHDELDHACGECHRQ